MNVKQIKEKLRALLQAARAIADQAVKDDRALTAEEKTKIEGMLTEAADLKAQLAEAQHDDDLRAAILGYEADLGAAPAPASPPGVPSAPGRVASVGERFVNSSEWQQWIKTFAGGRIPESARGLRSPPVSFDSLMKDLITGSSDTSAGAFVPTDYTGIYEAYGRYDLTVLALIPRRTTGSDLVEFVQQTTRVQEAAPVAEANVTEYSGATGEVSGIKPEGAMAFAKVQAPVRTIAVWVPATKRALSDAGQLRGIIDQELRDDLNEELEDQCLNGDGTGENMTGILQTAGILTQAWNTDMLTTTRQAVTTLLTTGATRPTAWVFNPNDWESIELLQDANNRYYYGGPYAQGPARLWGYPVAQSQSISEGSCLLGDWRKAILWDREQSTISVSDSHEDFFIRNMVAILAELRAAFGVIRPHGFIEVDLTAGS